MRGEKLRIFAVTERKQWHVADAVPNWPKLFCLSEKETVRNS